jgi:ATP adenylyltransferase
MQSPPLFAPWRLEYLKSLGHAPASDACFLCEASHELSESEKRERLVLWTSEHCVVLINRFPYTNGHLLIAPQKHKADFDELSEPELLDLQVQTRESIAVLKRAMSPQGFNVGINLGRCAGAGVPGHLHQHVVPRWAGDTNFISVVGEVRVVPQAMSQLYDELMRVRGIVGKTS